MRISDWSPEVCSSDLTVHLAPPSPAGLLSLGFSGLKRDRGRSDIPTLINDDRAFVGLFAAERHTQRDRHVGRILGHPDFKAEVEHVALCQPVRHAKIDRKSTRLNSSH